MKKEKMDNKSFSPEFVSLAKIVFKNAIQKEVDLYLFRKILENKFQKQSNFNVYFSNLTDGFTQTQNYIISNNNASYQKAIVSFVKCGIQENWLEYLLGEFGVIKEKSENIDKKLDYLSESDFDVEILNHKENQTEIENREVNVVSKENDNDKEENATYLEYTVIEKYKYCRKCGKQIYLDSSFCKYCGVKNT